MICTCHGMWPHESWCGKPEREDDCTCDGDTINPDCTEHGHLTEPAPA